MKHKFTILVVLVFTLMGFIVPTSFAQEEDTAMPNTITVTGNGAISANPDIATLSVGVEMFGEDILTVYGDVNTALTNVMAALQELGVATEDMQTAGLDIYVQPSFGEPSMSNETRVSNRLNIVIRDLSQIETIIDAAVNNGANSIFGLQFSVSDRSQLQSDARAAALADARNRAEEIASNLGVTLGSAVRVVEFNNGGSPRPFAFDEAQNSGGAVIEPGQLAVSMSVEVTYSFDG